MNQHIFFFFLFDSEKNNKQQKNNNFQKVKELQQLDLSTNA